MSEANERLQAERYYLTLDEDEGHEVLALCYPEWNLPIELQYVKLSDYATCEAALAQKTRECEELRETLADANKVHTNILRGTIALTKAQAIHIAGLPADIEAQVEQLERQVADLSKPVTPEEIALAENQEGKVPIDQILRGFIYRRDVENRIAARATLRTLKGTQK